MMTGMHAFHVLTGVIFLAIVLRNGLRGLYSPEKHWAVEAAAVYWHFVDVVWIFFYPALYLIGVANQNLASFEFTLKRRWLDSARAGGAA